MNLDTLDLDLLTPEALRAYIAHLEEIQLKLKEQDPAKLFSWNPWQEFVLFDATGMFRNPLRVVVMLGGNRSGKSAGAKGMMSLIQSRQSPVVRQFLAQDRLTNKVRAMGPLDPMNIWVIPPKKEKYDTDWDYPTDGYGIKYWLADRYMGRQDDPVPIHYARQPARQPEDCMIVEHGRRKINKAVLDTIVGKYQTQDLEAFESSEVHLAIFDEEPPKKVTTSTTERLVTSNGILVYSFTPLHGISWTHKAYYKPIVKHGMSAPIVTDRIHEELTMRLGEDWQRRGERSRAWIQVPEDVDMGATVLVQMHQEDNPRVPKRAIKEKLADPRMTDAEKAARLYGEYGYVEGALIPLLSGIDVDDPAPEHGIYVVDNLPGDRKKTPEGEYIVKTKPLMWRIVADPNKSYGGLLECLDSDGNHWLASEHLEDGWPNRLHAKAFRKMMKKWATTGAQEYWADSGAAGKQSIIDLEDFGLPFLAVPKGPGSVPRSIKLVRSLSWCDPKHRHPITGKLGAPRIYFFRQGMVSKYEEDGRPIVGCRLAEQISAARQVEDEDARFDTPDKSSKNRLDLFDCLRYIALLGGAFDTEENYGLGLPRDPDILTDDLLNPRPEEIVHPLDRELWLPEYSWK